MKARRRVFAALVLAAWVGATACKAGAPPESRRKAATASTPAATASTPAATASTPAAVHSPPPPPSPAPSAAVDFVEFVTPSAKTSDPLPLVVGIHGLGDSPENFAGVLRGLDVPARVILPRGVAEYHRGFSWFPFDRARTFDQGSDEMQTSATRVAGLLDKLRKTRNTRGKPIVTGFSQGGLLTFLLAVHHPEQVHRAFPVGGWLPPPFRARRKPGVTYPDIVAFHGLADTLVPFGNAESAVTGLTQLGYHATLRPYPGVGHTISREMRTDLLEAIGAALAVAKALPPDTPPAATPKAGPRKTSASPRPPRSACLEECRRRNMYTDCAGPEGMMPCPCDCP